MTSNTPDLAKLYQDAEHAREHAEAVAAQLAAGEAEAQRERTRRHRAEWQRFADTYRPAELRQSVVDAEAELRHALADTDLGHALIGYLTAMLRESQHHRLARAATAEGGATLPAGVEIPSTHIRSGSGEPMAGWLNEGWAASVLSQFVYDAATAQTDAEEQQVRGRAADAFASVSLPEPEAYKVVARGFTEERVDQVGATAVNFAASPDGPAAYLAPDHPALRWYSQHELFDVMPVFAVPSTYADAVQRMSLVPELYGPTGAASTEYHPTAPDAA